MKHNERVKLQEIADRFSISWDGGNCLIESKMADLAAYVYRNQERVEYSVTGCYDSGLDLVEIDMDELVLLQGVVQFIFGKSDHLSKEDVEKKEVALKASVLNQLRELNVVSKRDDCFYILDSDEKLVLQSKNKEISFHADGQRKRHEATPNRVLLNEQSLINLQKLHDLLVDSER